MSRSVKLVLSALIALAVVAVPLVAGLASTTPTRDDAFRIDTFDREVTLRLDGRLEVVETIAVTFTQPRRGIFRDLEGEGPAGTVDYRVVSVDGGDASLPWRWVQESTPAGEPRIRIGGAGITLQPGPQVYRLLYEVDGLVFRPEDRPDQAQLRIDVPGDAWPVDIAETTMTVRLPVEPTSVACVVGTAGDDEPCPASTTSERVVTQTLPALGPSETGTVAIELPADALTASLPEVDVAEVTTRGEGRAPFEVPKVPGILATLLLLALPALLLESLRARRVYRDVVTDPAVHDRVAPTAELEPPDGLAPAELAAVDRAGGFLTGGADVLLATLIDLQIRGVVTSSGGQDDDAPLTFGPGPNAPDVHEWERLALEQLMPNGTPIVFDGEYDAATSRRSSGATSSLTAHANAVFQPGSRYVHDEGGALRGGGYALGIIATLVLGGLVGLAAMALFGVPPVAVVAAWVALPVAWVLLSLVWRLERRPLTSEGRDVIARTRAFEHFLTEVHADRLDFAGSRADVGVTHPAVALLPYAVVLGLGASWLERFEPVLTEAAAQGRAGGVSGTDTWFLHPTSFVAASTLHSASITNPASSSGGGGGGAGSGGGGGGGGSW
ncbi:MAG: DUF2207 domain-containing protein [Nitriliruptor sp.]|uniref:DUF2207 family protein n=1 Tax=Nitriliruptor sp. TaxID=2448056 RepID=UPI0034A004FB